MTYQTHQPGLDFWMLDFDEDDLNANQQDTLTKSQRAQMLRWWRQQHASNRLVMIIFVALSILFGVTQIWAFTLPLVGALIATVVYRVWQYRKFLAALDDPSISTVEGVIDIIQHGNQWAIIEIGRKSRFRINSDAMKHFEEGYRYRAYVTHIPSFILSAEFVSTG